MASGQVEKERIFDESTLDDQFDEFLNRLELLESEEYNGVDDEDSDYSIKERILMLKLDRTAFEPLLTSIRTSRPSLYQAVLQHPLIIGQQKSSRKQSKKEKKRDRKNEMNREKEKALAQSRITRSQRRDKTGGSGDFQGAPIGTLADLTSSDKRIGTPNEILGVVVAKTIAEGSLSGHLLTIALLLQILTDEKKKKKNVTNLNGIPIGNILGGLFEKSDNDDDSDTSEMAGVSSTRNSTGSIKENNSVLLNPFHDLLLSPRDERAKSVAFSDMSRGDIGSIDESRTEESTSQLSFHESHSTGLNYRGGGGALSDSCSGSGSTAESIMAEQSNESASVIGDEDMTEDEQLAQAVAMSMRNTPITNSNNNNININNNTQNIPNFDINIREQTYAVSSSAASAVSSSGSVSFNRNFSSCKQQSNMILEPMSTYGPFTCPEFVRSLNSTAYGENSGEIPLVSVRHTIFALLTILRTSADKLLKEDFSLSLLSSSTSSSTSSTFPSGKFESNQIPTSMFVNHTPTIAPNSLTFLLIEFILDLLLNELKSHNTSFQGKTLLEKRVFDQIGQVSSQDSVSTPLTETLLKERDRERKARQTLFVFNNNMGNNDKNELNEYEIELREFAFHRYFLIWSTSSVLRILRSTFKIVRDTRQFLSSLGLNFYLQKNENNENYDENENSKTNDNDKRGRNGDGNEKSNYNNSNKKLKDVKEGREKGGGDSDLFLLEPIMKQIIRSNSFSGSIVNEVPRSQSTISSSSGVPLGQKLLHHIEIFLAMPLEDITSVQKMSFNMKKENAKEVVKEDVNEMENVRKKWKILEEDKIGIKVQSNDSGRDNENDIENETIVTNTLDEIFGFPGDESDIECQKMLNPTVKQQLQQQQQLKFGTSTFASNSTMINASTKNVPAEQQEHSMISYRHVLRINAIDCYISGIDLFRPTQMSKDTLLLYLLQNSNKPINSNSHTYTSNLFGLGRKYNENDRINGNMIYMLQELSYVTSKKISKMRISTNSASGSNSNSTSSSTSSFSSPASIPNYRSLSGLKSVIGENSISSSEDNDESHGPKIDQKSIKIVKKLNDIDIENLLFERLSGIGLMTPQCESENDNVDNNAHDESMNQENIDTNDYDDATRLEGHSQGQGHGQGQGQGHGQGQGQGKTLKTPGMGPFIFSGELKLLYTLQQKYIKAFTRSTSGNAVNSPNSIGFDVMRCHSDIAISGDNKVVTHRNSKVNVHSTSVLYFLYVQYLMYVSYLL